MITVLSGLTARPKPPPSGEFYGASPRRQLEKHFGYKPQRGSRVRVDDYVKFGIGDTVHRKDDPRHLGECLNINNGIVKIRWFDGDNHGYESFDDVQKYDEEKSWRNYE